MRVLVLSGGGSHGAWQAGAIKALSERHTYDAVVGTSVGAVNAAGLSAMGADGTINLWKSLNGTSSVMKLNLTWPWKMDGLYSFSPLRSILVQALECRAYSVPAFASVFDLSDSTVKAIKLGMGHEADADVIVGSCAISGIQSPTGTYLDGGHKEVTPVRYAVEGLSATHVDVVMTGPIVEYRPGWTKPSFFPIVSIMLRALGGMIDEISRTDIDKYSNIMTVYAPGLSMSYSSLDYNPSHIAKMIDLGYSEASA